MSLRDLIRGAPPATAKVAISATHRTGCPPSVATIAGIAVATPPLASGQWDLPTIEERAAIIEHDGGVSRALADALAWMELSFIAKDLISILNLCANW